MSEDGPADYMPGTQGPT